MKKAIISLLAAFPVASATDSAKGSNVTAQFLGSSGGMKLVSDDGPWLMVQQEKIEERTADGKSCPQCFRMNVAGQNEWSPLQETSNENGTSYSTTFTVKEGDVSFQLTAHLAVTTTTTTELAPCDECHKNTTKTTNFPGVCWRQQCTNPSNGTGNCVKQCTDVSDAATGECPEKYEACTNEVTISESELKFSFILSGVQCKSMENIMHYGLVLKSSKDNATVDESSKSDSKDLKINGVGIVNLPTVATISTLEQPDREIVVNVTHGHQGSHNTINFQFPALTTEDALYYDPSLSLYQTVPDANSVGALAVTASTFLIFAL